VPGRFGASPALATPRHSPSTTRSGSSSRWGTGRWMAYLCARPRRPCRHRVRFLRRLEPPDAMRDLAVLVAAMAPVSARG
jgi:hypothetical protein